MRRLAARIAIGLLLALVAVAPLKPVTSQGPSMPEACSAFAFSIEEDFITQGPVPPDGDPYISDGDLIGPECVLCARNADLLTNLDVEVDLGLDAADVIDARSYLVAFSTELDSPHGDQFTAGDLLTTNGVIIPNLALTHLLQVGYDLGLDALHFVGTQQSIDAFLTAVLEGQLTRDYWLRNPGELAGWLAEYQVDIWFSTEGTWMPAGAAGFLDGDVLSARTGTVVAHIRDLLPATVPAGIPNRGVDFGLDALSSGRSDAKEGVHFSTEILYDNEPSFTDGDVLLAGTGVIHTNKYLIQCFEPKAYFLGLDALHKRALEALPGDVYLPVVLRALDETPQ